MLRPHVHPPFPLAGGQQARPADLGIRQSLFPIPRLQSVSRRGLEPGPLAAPPGSAGSPGRFFRHSGAGTVDRARRQIERGRFGGGNQGRAQGTGPAAGLVQGGQCRHRRHRARRAAVSAGAASPGENCAAGGRDGHFTDAGRGPAPGVGRARTRKACAPHCRPGDGLQDRALATGGRQQVPAPKHSDDRRRPWRPQSRPLQPGAVLSHCAQSRGRVMEGAF